MNKNYLKIFLIVVLMISVFLIVGCQAEETPEPEVEEPPTIEEPAEPEEAEEMGFDWKQAEGTKITVFLSETPMAQAIRENIDDFKELTGIDIEYLVVSENEYWSKLAVDLSSGAGQFHVFMSGPTLNWGYSSAGQIQPLDPYMNDPSLTPEDWNYNDFFEWAIVSNQWDGTPGPEGLGKGSLWSVPVNSVNNLLTYRKDLFDEWGLEPPTTWQEWADTARQIMEITGGEVDGKPFYAVVQRGGLDITTLSGPFWSGFSSYGGQDFHDDLTPAMNEDLSVEFQELYMDTIKETGSPEWPNQMWFDVQQGFTNGQYAMVFDCDNFIPTYEAEGSAVAGKLAYIDVPAGPGGDRVSMPWTWGFSMNSQTEGDQAVAAWLFIAWASSEDSMMTFAPTGSWPTRKSVWDSQEMIDLTNPWGDGTFRSTMDKVLNEQVFWTVSPMVDMPGVWNTWVAGLHDYYFDKGSMEEIMDGVAADSVELMTESGTLK